MTQPPSKNIALILLAAGRGSRFGLSAGRTKTELELDGRPVFAHALDRFAQAPHITQRLLVVHPDERDGFAKRWAALLAQADTTLCPGGLRDRWESVHNALQTLHPDTTHVAIHDAARPCTDPASIHRLLSALDHHHAVIPVLPVSSTLKQTHADNPTHISNTIDRSGLVEVQTPQCFRLDMLKRAFDNTLDDLKAGKAHVTDDASLIERLGETVIGIEGDPGNLKITRAGDDQLALAILRHRYQSQ
ncbi:MAG: 2-C-methyl-D-erythritol 4-phosphate cytidylyltransferase [Phycisphaeraceae bacterium]